jgi:glycosyltransferase involved in cell wall biosynthesis
LVVKVRHAPKLFLQQLRALLADYPHIYFIEEAMSKAEVNGLIKSVDAFVSLHRAEGFGLVLAEAMYLGTPCVATNWSANTEFMTPDTAALVDYKLVKIGRNTGPYSRHSTWAEPDIDQAAAWMRRFVAEPDLCRSLAEAAADHSRNVLNPTKLSARIGSRLKEIRDESNMKEGVYGKQSQ